MIRETQSSSSVQIQQIGGVVGFAVPSSPAQVEPFQGDLTPTVHPLDVSVQPAQPHQMWASLPPSAAIEPFFASFLENQHPNPGAVQTMAYPSDGDAAGPGDGLITMAYPSDGDVSGTRPGGDVMTMVYPHDADTAGPGPGVLTMAYPSDADTAGPGHPTPAYPGYPGRPTPGDVMTMAYPSDGDTAGPRPGDVMTMAYPSDGDVAGPRPGDVMTMAYPSDADTAGPAHPGRPTPGPVVTMAYPSDGDAAPIPAGRRPAWYNLARGTQGA